MNLGTYTCVSRDWIVFEDDNVPPHVVGKNDHGRYHILIMKVHYRNGVIHNCPGHVSLAYERARFMRVNR